MNRRTWLVAASATLWAAPAVRAQEAHQWLPYLQRSQVQEYIDALVASHELPRGWLESTLAQGRYSEPAERLTTPASAPPWTRNWAEYRARNVDERRIRDGVAFLQRSRSALVRAQQRFGVPHEVIVAIIGVETQYGRLTGSLRTLDVLMTLAFDYTRRAALYRDELAQFLLLCREQGLDPLAQRGSFAGALGLPQFMPSSIRRYAVDFDGAGRIDLARSTTDAIGSVGNFLLAHGWQRDLPVQFRASTDRSVIDILGRGIRATYRWGDVAALGVAIDGTLAADTRVLLLDLAYVTASGDEATEFRLGTANMSALLHYNRSYFYAASVADLAQAIGQRATA